jgi:hypothetical protein
MAGEARRDASSAIDVRHSGEERRGKREENKPPRHKDTKKKTLEIFFIGAATLS